MVVFSNSFDTGTSSTLFRIVANSSRAFLVELPACNNGVVVVDGVVRILIISSTACFRKLAVLFLGKLSCPGKRCGKRLQGSDGRHGKSEPPLAVRCRDN